MVINLCSNLFSWLFTVMPSDIKMKLSTESQKRTSVLQIKRDFLATRSMTGINVGLALSSRYHTTKYGESPWSTAKYGY